MPVQILPGRLVAGLLALTLACTAAASTPAEPTPSDPVRIVALGNSLTAGYGLGPGQAFPDRLARALAAKGIAASIANAGVSGDTASGGLARLEWSVPDGTQAVILELGANDALRGVDPKVTRGALDAMLHWLKARRIAVLLCGMRAPPNLGRDYGEAFDAVFPQLARAHDVVFYPFFLEGIAADRRLNQPDGLHPTAEGVERIVERILPRVEELIARIARTPNP